MSGAREIKSKIASVKNTQKITGAMELVAASKMRRAQDQMAKSRPYAKKIRSVIAHVSKATSEYQHPYMKTHAEVKRVGFIVISTDRGLCGGLNINLFKAALIAMKGWSEKNVDIDLCLVGRKAETFFNRFGGNIVATKTNVSDRPKVDELIGVVKVMLDKYDNGELQALYLVNNDFINTMSQKPVVERLLPLCSEETKKDHTGEIWDYIYEPDEAHIILDVLLKRYIESQVYQAVVENIACEQSARMVAMKSATDNAGDIMKELDMAYNKARQASITREISEIVSGAAAIE